MTDRLPDHALRKLLDDARPLLDEESAGDHRIGKYRLIREIGRGGMGVVWEAEDTELERRVALKLLSAPFDEEARRRFLREARSAARLSHPHIAAVYEADEQRLAMQLVDGVPLSRYPRGDWKETAGFLRDAALAAHHAHQRGIIHRDLKPANLMVHDAGIVVTDFGLAKEISLDSSLSVSGRILGTPAFMAPEQADGRVQDTDPRTDVYGLGATLYERLAGRPPFADQDVYRLLRKVMEDDPPLACQVQSEVPRDLAIIAARCLAKEPERRYATAEDLARDLDRFLAGEPILARAPSLRYRLGKFLVRRRAVVTVASLGVVGIAISLLVLGAQQRAARGAMRLSESIHAIVTDAEQLDSRGQNEEARELRTAGIQQCREYLNKHDVAEVHYFLGRLLRSQNLHDEARAELDLALHRDPELIQARLERGLLMADQLASEERGQALEGSPPSTPDLDAWKQLALADLEAAAAETSPVLRTTSRLHAEAEVARLRGESPRARKLLDRIRDIDPAHPGAMLARSRLELSEGNSDAAWHAAMSALDLYRGFGPAYLAQSGSSEKPSVSGQGSDSLPGLGSPESDAAEPLPVTEARLLIEDVEGALADFDQALADNPNDAMAYGTRGLVHARRAARLGDGNTREEALQAWQRAIEDYDAALTLQPHLSGALNNRGVCHAERERLFLELGRVEEATRERQAAGQDFTTAIQQAPRFALALLNRGQQRRRSAEAAGAAVRSEEAWEWTGLALQDLEDAGQLRSNDEEIAVAQALVYRLRARLTEARGVVGHEWWDRCEESLHGAVRLKPDSARAVGHLALVLLEQGDSQGRQLLEQALNLFPAPRFRRVLEAKRETSAP